MKDYFVFEVGSRGCVEGFRYLRIENIEGYLDEKQKENSKDGESEFEDLYGWNNLGEGYVLGVGDEMEIYYVDVESDVYSNWIKERGIEGDINDDDVMNLIDRLY